MLGIPLEKDVAQAMEVYFEYNAFFSREIPESMQPKFAELYMKNKKVIPKEWQTYFFLFFNCSFVIFVKSWCKLVVLPKLLILSNFYIRNSYIRILFPLNMIDFLFFDTDLFQIAESNQKTIRISLSKSETKELQLFACAAERRAKSLR